MNVNDMKHAIRNAVDKAHEDYPNDGEQRALTFAAVLSGAIGYHSPKVGEEIWSICTGEKPTVSA